MTDRFVPIADGFWNIRGSFRLGGVLDLGTQSSLARLGSGRFVLLDSYPLRGAVREAVMELTDGGSTIEAVLNLHPFHTVHVAELHRELPHAVHHGTARHHSLFPELPWHDLRTEDPELHARYAEDFEFLVPQGVEFIPDDDRLHFASVLALHKATGTLHVDDTLTFTRVPVFGGLAFHPTLGFVLHKRAGAAAQFRAWARDLADRCDSVEHLCTAHMRSLPPGGSVGARVREALAAVEGTLQRHARKWG